MKKNNKKGFTLAELLIVVAIIAVLTAIAIPVFSSQLEKSREATDLANIRAAYAEVMVEALDDETATGLSKTVTLKQTIADWTTTTAEQTLKDLVGDANVSGAVTANGEAVITWVPGTTSTDGHCTIALS